MYIANRRWICILAALTAILMLCSCGAGEGTKLDTDLEAEQDSASASAVLAAEDAAVSEINVNDDKTAGNAESAEAPSDRRGSAKNGADNVSDESTKDSENSGGAYTCTITIKCDTLLSHKDELDGGVSEILPSDGYILHETERAFEEGDSVFDVLLAVTAEKKIHMEFSKTPAYDSAYIEGIANIYEFDCGDVSGWMYSVNGEFPSFGCNQYEVKSGDKIEWLYSCDLGRDIGGAQ